MSLTEFFAKLIVQLIAIAIGFIPVWIGLLVYALTKPDGFWQTIVILGGWAILLGGIQLILLFAFIAVTLQLWFDSTHF